MTIGTKGMQDDSYFCVEWSNSLQTDDFNDTFFSDEASALDFATGKIRSFRHVWVSEYGLYKTQKGNAAENWIYFWWTDDPYWGDCPKERGLGVPEGRKRLVSYTPLVPAGNGVAVNGGVSNVTQTVDRKPSFSPELKKLVSRAYRALQLQNFSEDVRYAAVLAVVVESRGDLPKSMAEELTEHLIGLIEDMDQ